MVELSFGRVPEDESILRALTVGLDKISSFIKDEYFASYIKQGGSKIKFVTGKKGAGKTHLLHLLSFDAQKEGLLTVSLDAKNFLLSDITNLYTAVLEALPFEDLINKATENLTESLGYDWHKDRDQKSFNVWLTDKGISTVYTRKEVRDEVRKSYNDNPNFDYNFAQILSLLIGNRLGQIGLTEEDLSFIKSYLTAKGDLKLSQVRSFGLAGYKISKVNARFMLRSLSELVKMAGYTGLFVSIDNLDTMLSNSSLNPVKYTKMRRDDSYEVIRELIDDIDSFRYFFLVFGFDRILIDNETNGLKSYQALWLRMQNEIVSSRINLFADLFDLDKINLTLYDKENISEMSKRLASILTSYDISANVINETEAEKLIKEAKYGGVSVPLLVNQTTLKLEKKL